MGRTPKLDAAQQRKAKLDVGGGDPAPEQLDRVAARRVGADRRARVEGVVAIVAADEIGAGDVLRKGAFVLTDRDVSVQSRGDGQIGEHDRCHIAGSPKSPCTQLNAPVTGLTWSRNRRPINGDV